MSSGGYVQPAQFVPNAGDDLRHSRVLRKGLTDIRSEFLNMVKERIKQIGSEFPKEMSREYTIPEKGIVREIGPIIYGFSMTMGADRIPRIREFGNLKISGGNEPWIEKPEVEARVEREPLIDG